jgi:hypothetical protein
MVWPPVGGNWLSAIGTIRSSSSGIEYNKGTGRKRAVLLPYDGQSGRDQSLCLQSPVLTKFANVPPSE